MIDLIDLNSNHLSVGEKIRVLVLIIARSVEWKTRRMIVTLLTASAWSQEAEPLLREAAKSNHDPGD